MSYLIFGGSGFIGTHLVNLLHGQYPAATIYNLDVVENNHGGKSVFVHCDVRQPIELGVPFSDNDVIFNFSAVHRTPGHPDRDYFETNIRGAENVTEFAERHGIRKIVFTSSIAPYGASEDLKEETTLPMPNTPYGISKLVAEKIHGAWQAKNQQERQLTIVRPGVVFGTGENGNFTRLYWGIRSRRFVYPGRKDTIKGCIYVKDLVRFMLYRVEHHQEGVELYNCTYEPAFTIEQICHAMMKVTGMKRNLVKIPGGLLMGAAAVAGVLGGRALGIHPARVKKLMVSTNISGKKLAASGYKFRYTFQEALEDWFNDNEGKGLR